MLTNLRMELFQALFGADRNMNMWCGVPGLRGVVLGPAGFLMDICSGGAPADEYYVVMLLMVMDSARLPGTTYHTRPHHTALPVPAHWPRWPQPVVITIRDRTFKSCTLSLTTGTLGQCCKSRTPIEECQGGACFVHQLVLIFL